MQQESITTVDGNPVYYKPGDVVAGNYVLYDCLGVSARSSVFQCRHKDLDGPFLAIKILNPQLAKDEEVVARFNREVISSYNVSHPNVVRTHEFIRDGELVAYTMEFLEHGTLKQRLDSGEPISIEDVVSVASQLADGLNAIHLAGLVHRNVKPGNIFFSADGVVKISDFGIAHSSDGPKLTNAGEVLGTVGYASPEYLETGKVDQRSDIYATGLVIYEMITGVYPFQASNPLESLKLRLTSEPVSPSDLRLDCPLELSNIVLKALKHKPEERQKNSQELFDEITMLGVSPAAGEFVGRERQNSFFTSSFLTPRVELGIHHERERQNTILGVINHVQAESAKRSLAFAGMMSGGLLAVSLAAIGFSNWNSGEVVSLSEITDDKVVVESVQVEPVKAQASEKVSSATIKQIEVEATETPGLLKAYKVEPGDTLNAIAKKLGTNSKKLLADNNIKDPNSLNVGSLLIVSQ